MPEKVQPIYKADPYEINTRLSVIQRLLDDIDLRLKKLEQIASLDFNARTYDDIINLGKLVDGL